MVEFKKLTPLYVGQVCELEKCCFSHPWNSRDITEQINSPYGIYYAAVQNGRVLGYIGAFMGADVVYINNIAVFPEYRRHGIASALIRALLHEAAQRGATELTLEVRSANAGARALYERLGFVTMGTRKNYYTDPDDDAIIMNYELYKNK